MANEKRYQEGVVFDNQFHRNLSGMRNQSVKQNHPDVDRMISERHQTTRQTLYSLSSAQDLPSATRSESEKDEVERGICFDDGAPAIYNFRHSIRLLGKEVKRAAKFNRPLTICMFSFPELPLVYSKYGVLAQESTIRFVGDLLAQFVDLDFDICGRYETYRFLAAFPERSPKEAVEIAERIRQAFASEPVVYHQYKFFLKASIGLVSLPHHGTQWKELIAKADLATDMVIESGGDSIGSC
ncbi:MAG: diguanylate cyclase [Candidatus Obscuribacterales bacterium]|nr:diguanylate cyclase [Candidatus Obscuribacterales bacterium]